MSKLYRCTSCNKHKQLSEFYTRASGKQKGQRVSTICKICSSEITKQKRLDNPDLYKEQLKNRRAAKPELYKTIDAKYRSNNIEICRERSNKSSKAYYERYPWKVAAKGARYRARKATGQPVCLPAIELAKIKSIYKSCKSISDKSGVKHHVDHIIPLAGKDVCGLHVPWNLQVIPARDNLMKSNKLIEDMI